MKKIINTFYFDVFGVFFPMLFIFTYSLLLPKTIDGDLIIAFLFFGIGWATCLVALKETYNTK